MKELFKKVAKFKLKIPLKYLRIIFVIIVLSVFGLEILEAFKSDGFSWKIARNEAGDLAWKLLIFIIFSSLFSKLFPKIKIFRQILPLRKEAGILVFWIVLAHTVFHFIKAGVLGDFNGMYFQAIDRDWAILMGTISFILMIPLTITSNNFFMKLMGGKNWKRLHLITHLVFILAATHKAFIGLTKYQEIEKGPIVLVSFYLAAYLYLYVKKRNPAKL